MTTLHSCPPWCGNDDVGDGSYVVHRSTHKITGDWHDTSCAVPERRMFSIELASTTGTGNPREMEAQILLDGLADHPIDMDVWGARALIAALELAVDRAEGDTPPAVSGSVIPPIDGLHDSRSDVPASGAGNG